MNRNSAVLLLIAIVGLVATCAAIDHRDAASSSSLLSTDSKAHAGAEGNWGDLLAKHYSNAKNKIRGIKEDIVEKKDEVVEEVKTKFNAIQAAFKNKVLGIKDELMAKLKTVATKCPEIYNEENRCHADYSLELETSFDRDSHAKQMAFNNGKAFATSERNEVWFWTEAARTSKLARYAYNDREDMNRDDVQVLDFTDKSKTGADAFISVRGEEYMPGFYHRRAGMWKDTDPEYKERGEEWELYRTKEKTKWKGTKAAPAAVEVVVRGTASLLDWVVDAAAIQRSFDVPLHSNPSSKVNIGKVHSGFKLQYDALIEFVLRNITPFMSHIRSGKTKLYFVGHSLGGAVCQLLAADITARFELKKLPAPHTYYKSDLVPVARVFTFGSPRVGDPQFAKFMRDNVRHVRFKFMGDVVSEVPLNSLLGMSYEHGDTYAIGLGVKSYDEYWTFRTTETPYVAYCMPECTPMTTILTQLLSFHAMDWSYAGSIESLWIQQRDDGGFHSTSTAFVDTDMYGHLTALKSMIGSEFYGQDTLSALRCMGVSDCQHEISYPHATRATYETCDKQMKAAGVSFDRDVWKQMRLSRMQVDEAQEYYLKFKIPFNKCMMEATKGDTYFSHMAPRDWTMCFGNVYCIFARNKMNRSCYGNRACEKEVTFPGVSDAKVNACVTKVNNDIRSLYKYSPEKIPKKLLQPIWFLSKYIHNAGNGQTINDKWKNKAIECIEAASPNMKKYDNVTPEQWKKCEGDLDCVKLLGGQH